MSQEPKQPSIEDDFGIKPLRRCIECGFLALRNEITGQLDEASRAYRMDAIPPKLLKLGIQGVALEGLHSAYEYPYGDVPLCFMQKADFEDELPTNTTGQPYPANMVWAKLSNPRVCDDEDGFTPWQQGFTPKEHRERLDRQWRIRHEEEVRQAVLRSEDERGARVEAREGKRDAEAKDRHRNELFVFGLVLGGLTVLAAFIERGSDLWPF